MLLIANRKSSFYDRDANPKSVALFARRYRAERISYAQPLSIPPIADCSCSFRGASIDRKLDRRTRTLEGREHLSPMLTRNRRPCSKSNTNRSSLNSYRSTIANIKLLEKYRVVRKDISFISMKTKRDFFKPYKHFVELQILRLVKRLPERANISEGGA